MSRPDHRAAPLALPKPGFGNKGGGFGRFRKTAKNPSASMVCRGFGSFGSFGIRDVDESDPELLEEGVIAPADPVEPILELLTIGEPEAAADTLATMARTWLDPTTWRELEDLALADPDRCCAALEAVLARDPAALDRALDGPELEAGMEAAA